MADSWAGRWTLPDAKRADLGGRYTRDEGSLGPTPLTLWLPESFSALSYFFLSCILYNNPIDICKVFFCILWAILGHYWIWVSGPLESSTRCSELGLRSLEPTHVEVWHCQRPLRRTTQEHGGAKGYSSACCSFRKSCLAWSSQVCHEVWEGSKKWKLHSAQWNCVISVLDLMAIF